MLVVGGLFERRSMYLLVCICVFYLLYTHGLCVLILYQWRDVQFKFDSEQQIF